jgi:hypothetical protein
VLNLRSSFHEAPVLAHQYLVEQMYVGLGLHSILGRKVLWRSGITGRCRVSVLTIPASAILRHVDMTVATRVHENRPQSWDEVKVASSIIGGFRAPAIKIRLQAKVALKAGTYMD